MIVVEYLFITLLIIILLAALVALCFGASMCLAIIIGAVEESKKDEAKDVAK